MPRPAASSPGIADERGVGHDVAQRPGEGGGRTGHHHGGDVGKQHGGLLGAELGVLWARVACGVRVYVADLMNRAGLMNRDGQAG